MFLPKWFYSYNTFMTKIELQKILSSLEEKLENSGHLSNTDNADEHSRLKSLENAIEKLIKKSSSVEHSLKELMQNNMHQSSIVESSLESILTFDKTGLIIDCNMMAEKLFGLPRYEINNKRNLCDLIEFSKTPGEREAYIEKLITGDIYELGERFEKNAWRSDKTQFSAELVIISLYYSKGQPLFVAFVRDITDNKEMARQLAYQANHDTLTELYNRRAFEQRLESAFESTRTDEKRHVLCYIDLQNLKAVNDTCGHTAGDALLKQLSGQFKGKLRDSDILARIGGDEFGLLMEGCSPEHAQFFIQQIMDLITNFQFAWDGTLFEIGCNIGIIPINNSTRLDVSHVMGLADKACYIAQDIGINRVYSYDPSESEEALTNPDKEIYNQVQHAFNHNTFVTYFQPIAALDPEVEKKHKHYEVLIRMIDTEDHFISPDLFIPTCERYNLMPKLDRWVINATFAFVDREYRHVENWQDTVFGINLSGDSMADGDLLDFIKERIGFYHLPVSSFYFEITETAAISNLSKAVGFVKSLKEFGFLFALDDFGSGLSSFAYLKTFPVDYLKIDGQFVKDILTNKIDLAMVEAIQNIGHTMGLRTIAEFVESEAIMDLLREIGVDYAQGYGIGKPVAPEVLLENTLQASR